MGSRCHVRRGRLRRMGWAGLQLCLRVVVEVPSVRKPGAAGNAAIPFHLRGQAFVGTAFGGCIQVRTDRIHRVRIRRTRFYDFWEGQPNRWGPAKIQTAVASTTAERCYCSRRFAPPTFALTGPTRCKQRRRWRTNRTGDHAGEAR